MYSIEHFEVYLLGNKFTVYTNHQALVSAFEKPDQGFACTMVPEVLTKDVIRAQLMHALSRAPLPDG